MAPSPANVYADILRNDFAAFVDRAFRELNPGARFRPNWHIDLMAEQLELVRRGRSKRVIFNLPPRHLKSHIVSVCFIAWLLGHNPAIRILFITYAQDLSDKLARECRTLMMSEFYQAMF